MNIPAKTKINILMLGHKRISLREGNIESVVEELSTQMVRLGHSATSYNREEPHFCGERNAVGEENRR